jgi:hypothetical protein
MTLGDVVKIVQNNKCALDNQQSLAQPDPFLTHIVMLQRGAQIIQAESQRTRVFRILSHWAVTSLPDMI